MEEKYYGYDDGALRQLVKNLQQQASTLELQITRFGESYAPGHLLIDREQVLQELQVLQTELVRRQQKVAPLPTVHHKIVPMERAKGPPFVPTRHLRANEVLFGRTELLQSVSLSLVDGSSVNLIGERGFGKTSLVHHVIQYVVELDSTQCQLQPIAAQVNLKDNIFNAEQLYAAALKRIVQALNGKVLTQLDTHFAHVTYWSTQKQINYEQFQDALTVLRSEACFVLPILIIDDFDQLLRNNMRDGFLVPEFYNGLRALLGETLMSMLVVSEKALVEYFRAPSNATRLTSSFPGYFLPYRLDLLEIEDAEKLLFQKSPYQLQLNDVEKALKWVEIMHPALLQCAGLALYEMRSMARDYPWAFKRFQELRNSLIYFDS